MAERPFLHARPAPAKAPAPAEPGAPAAPSLLRQLQRALGNHAMQRLVDADAFEDRLARRQGGGEPLDRAAREFIEPRLGVDLGAVRIHTGAEPDAMAERVSANAFTAGTDVYFRSGLYNPGSSGGLRLLTHELVHVVQQQQGPVDGAAQVAGVTVSDPADRFEREADAIADQVMAGAGSKAPDTELNPLAGTGADAGGLQRDEDDKGDPGLFERASQYFRDSPVLQFGAGVATGGLAGATPGGFLAAPIGQATGADKAYSPSFRAGYGLGEGAWGLAQILAGIGGEAGGVALDATGVGALLGVPLNVASALVIAEGAADVGVGFSTMMAAMDESAGGSGTRLPELDQTGKVHGKIPDHVPEDATPEQLMQLRDELRQSIETRKAEQLRLGEHGPHRERIRQEEALLRQIEKKLSGS